MSKAAVMRKPWMPDEIERLRAFCAQGDLSLRAIGEIMHRSKSSIIGAAHRANIAVRENPRRKKPGARPAPKRIARAARNVRRPGEPSSPSPAPLSPAPPPTVPARRPGAYPADLSSACQWPIGEPGRPGFHFCGDPWVPGRPYCEDHCQFAYVPNPFARSFRDDR